MTLGSLVRWRNWWYLPTMETLSVFDAETGQCVSKWYVYSPYNAEHKRWYFYCNVDTLPKDDSDAFQPILSEWKKYVDKKLTTAYGSGAY